eukprot:g4499.t1
MLHGASKEQVARTIDEWNFQADRALLMTALRAWRRHAKLQREKLERELRKFRARRHLRSGMVFERKPVDYEDVPCHLCGGEIPPSERGKVGRWHFWKGAFLVIPCANLECRERQKERQEWLDATPPQTLYHQTDPESAKKILGSGKMIRGRCGVVGGGIYFAETPRETEWKAESKGIVLECQVKTGRHLLLDRSKEDPSLTFADLLRRGHDSVLMDRGEESTSKSGTPVQSIFALPGTFCFFSCSGPHPGLMGSSGPQSHSEQRKQLEPRLKREELEAQYNFDVFNRQASAPQHDMELRLAKCVQVLGQLEVPRKDVRKPLDSESWCAEEAPDFRRLHQMLHQQEQVIAQTLQEVRSDAESRLVQQMAHYEARCVGAPRLIASRCWTRDQEMPERSRSQRLKELLEKQCPHPFEANVCCEVVCFKDLRKAQGWGNPFRFCACSFWQVLAAEQPLLEEQVNQLASVAEAYCRIFSDHFQSRYNAVARVSQLEDNGGSALQETVAQQAAELEAERAHVRELQLRVARVEVEWNLEQALKKKGLLQRSYVCSLLIGECVQMPSKRAAIIERPKRGRGSISSKKRASSKGYLLARRQQAEQVNRTMEAKLLERFRLAKEEMGSRFELFSVLLLFLREQEEQKGFGRIGKSPFVFDLDVWLCEEDEDAVPVPKTSKAVMMLHQLAMTVNLSFDDARLAKNAFEKQDHQVKGVLEYEDFVQAVLDIHQTINHKCTAFTMTQCEHLCATTYPADEGSDGTVDLVQFLHWYATYSFHESFRQYQVPWEEVDNVKRHFDLVDTDHSGEIDFEEFSQILRRVLQVPPELDMPPNRARFFWKQLDTDGSGKVSPSLRDKGSTGSADCQADFAEFLPWWLKYFQQKEMECSDWPIFPVVVANQVWPGGQETLGQAL